jgi:hypothetical protein
MMTDLGRDPAKRLQDSADSPGLGGAQRVSGGARAAASPGLGGAQLILRSNN